MRPEASMAYALLHAATMSTASPSATRDKVSDDQSHLVHTWVRGGLTVPHTPPSRVLTSSTCVECSSWTTPVSRTMGSSSRMPSRRPPRRKNVRPPTCTSRSTGGGRRGCRKVTSWWGGVAPARAAGTSGCCRAKRARTSTFHASRVAWDRDVRSRLNGSSCTSSRYTQSCSRPARSGLSGDPGSPEAAALICGGTNSFPADLSRARSAAMAACSCSSSVRSTPSMAFSVRMASDSEGLGRRGTAAESEILHGQAFHQAACGSRFVSVSTGLV
mmetsp:Transcript_27471/g.87356  ORF Transcript_27471/g.87356 Transcript_27471/m.87356 type:complete len:273 (+) Transcript_27471:1074-1892(+)